MSKSLIRGAGLLCTKYNNTTKRLILRWELYLSTLPWRCCHYYLHYMQHRQEVFQFGPILDFILVLKQSITINYSVHHFNVVHNFEFVNLFCECGLICNYLFIDSQENIKYFTFLHGGSLFLPTVKYP